MDSSAESVNNKLKKRKRDQTDWIPNQLDETDWFFVIHLPLTFIPTVADRPPMPSKPFGTSCYICLDDNMTNKAYTNKCWHPFCYPCIKRWAMKRTGNRKYPQCPVCKKDFKSIHHTLNPDNTTSWAYEVPHFNFFLSYHGAPCLFLKPCTFLPFLDNRWKYFHFYLTQLGISTPEGPGDKKGLRTIAAKHQRLSMYYNNLWSVPLPNERGKYLECSPVRFRRDRFVKNQLCVFMFRELRVLQVFLSKAHSVNLPNECVMEITSLLCVSLLAHNIHDEYIVGNLGKIFGTNLTKHFCYEFYNYACSGQHIRDYDRIVKTTRVLEGTEPVYDPMDDIYHSSFHPKRRRTVPTRESSAAKLAAKNYQVSSTKVLPYYIKIDCNFGGQSDELGKNDPEEYFSLVVPGISRRIPNPGITACDVIWPIWIRRVSRGRDVFLPKQLEPAQSSMLLALRNSMSNANETFNEADPFHRRVYGMIKYNRNDLVSQNITFCSQSVNLGGEEDDSDA